MKPLLATDYDESLVRYPCFVQPKLDGIRAYYKKGHLYSRDRVQWIDEVVEHILKALSHVGNIILDGELYIPGKSRQEINSIIGVGRKTAHPERDSVRFCIFDQITKEMIPFEQRYRTCHSLIGFGHPVSLVPLAPCHSKESADAIYDMYIAEGFEGMIYRVGNCYSNSGTAKENRSRYLLKRKPRFRGEYIVVGFLEGKDTDKGGKHVNSLGALELQTEGQVKFKVGTGFTDAQRDEIWKSRLNYLDRIAVVEYESLSDEGIPLQPVFIEWC